MEHPDHAKIRGCTPEYIQHLLCSMIFNCSMILLHTVQLTRPLHMQTNTLILHLRYLGDVHVGLAFFDIEISAADKIEMIKLAKTPCT